MARIFFSMFAFFPVPDYSFLSVIVSTLTTEFVCYR